MSRKALVIHPRLAILAGGEYVCFHICRILQEEGFEVTLVSDEFSYDEVEEMYGMGDVARACQRIVLPTFKPLLRRGMIVQRLFFTRKVQRMFKDLEADLIMSTQAASFYIPDRKVYHFVYDPHELLYDLKQDDASPGNASLKARVFYYGYMKLLRRLLLGGNSNSFYLPTSRTILAELKRHGVKNAAFLLPPVRTTFEPLPKENYVLQICRVVPQKRLEEYVEVARLVPEYRFFLLGKQSLLHSHYMRQFLRTRFPDNLTVLEGLTANNTELLRKAKVYMYTGYEPGLVLGLIEACAAGCYPVTTRYGGGYEMVRELGLGSTYSDVYEAAAHVKVAMQNADDSLAISKRTREVYSLARFEDAIRTLAQGASSNDDGQPTSYIATSPFFYLGGR